MSGKKPIRGSSVFALGDNFKVVGDANLRQIPSRVCRPLDKPLIPPDRHFTKDMDTSNFTAQQLEVYQAIRVLEEIALLDLTRSPTEAKLYVVRRLLAGQTTPEEMCCTGDLSLEEVKEIAKDFDARHVRPYPILLPPKPISDLTLEQREQVLGILVFRMDMLKRNQTTPLTPSAILETRAIEIAKALGVTADNFKEAARAIFKASSAQKEIEKQQRRMTQKNRPAFKSGLGL